MSARLTACIRNYLFPVVTIHRPDRTIRDDSIAGLFILAEWRNSVTRHRSVRPVLNEFSASWSSIPRNRRGRKCCSAQPVLFHFATVVGISDVVQINMNSLGLNGTIWRAPRMLVSLGKIRIRPDRDRHCWSRPTPFPESARSHAGRQVHRRTKRSDVALLSSFSGRPTGRALQSVECRPLGSVRIIVLLPATNKPNVVR